MMPTIFNHLENNGSNIWQNITPARYPEQHQGGIHQADGSLKILLLL
ncbi:TPA: hypothetical protein WGP81_001999 [Neisseria meningitidis]